MKRDDVNFDFLSPILSVDGVGGKLFWNERPLNDFEDKKSWSYWNSRHIGKEALTYRRPDGYKAGRLFGFPFFAHRVVWLLHHGSWPQCQIDHIDGNKSNNGIANLRDVSVRENSQNTRLSRRNKSGVTGVGWVPTEKVWVATIASRPIKKFKIFEDAVAARKRAEIELGYHANHGRVG